MLAKGKKPIIMIALICIALILAVAPLIGRIWKDGAVDPSEGTIGYTEASLPEGYSIRFSLYDNSQSIASSVKKLDCQAYDNLLQNLNTNTWSALDMKANQNVIFAFDITANGEMTSYHITTEGLLLCDGKMAQIKDRTLYHLFLLMEGTEDIRQNYLCWVTEDTRMQLVLDAGSFELTLKDQSPPVQNAFGRYGRIGDYIILSNGFESKKKTPIIYVFQQDGVSLDFHPELSHLESEWIIPDDTMPLLDSELVIELQYNLFGNKYLQEGFLSPNIRISPEDYLEFQEIMDDQLWWSEPDEVKKIVPVGSFTITVSNVNGEAAVVWDERVYSFVGNTFVHDGRYSITKLAVGNKLNAILRQAYDDYASLAGTYGALDENGRQIILMLYEDGTYKAVKSQKPRHAFSSYYDDASYPIEYGNYAMVEDMLILADERQDRYNSTTTVRLTDHGLDLIYCMSSLLYTPSDFLPSDAGIYMKVSFLSEESQKVLQETEFIKVDPELTWDFFDMLEHTDSWEDKYTIWPYVPIPYMQLHIQFGEEVYTYSVCENRYFKYEDRSIKLMDEQWAILMELIDYLAGI